MKITITSDKKYINISLRAIKFNVIEKILLTMHIDDLSILIDEGNQYIFEDCITTAEFIEIISNINTSFIMFDGIVKSCLMDKELDILVDKKILIDINFGENMTSILINKNNFKISKEEVLKMLKK